MKENNLQSTIKLLTLIFWGMFFGSGVVLIFMVYRVGNGYTSVGLENSPILLYTVISMSIGASVASMFISKSMLTKLNEKTDLNAKQEEYKKVVIVRMALMEAVILLAAVVFYLTLVKDYSYLG